MSLADPLGTCSSLLASVPEQNIRLRGNVIRLHREGNLGSGDVTISGVVLDDPSERMRKVTVSLGEADYNIAINAHETYRDVEVSGSMTQRGTRSYLSDLSQFAVLPDPEERANSRASRIVIPSR